jgi:hypothetical protein
MGSINWNRELLGSIVAGVIIDLLEWLFNGYVLGPQWREAMQSLGRPLQETPNQVMFYMVLGLIYGVVATSMYAAIRPRFGAGMKTAVYAGLGAWFLGYFLPTLTWVPMDLFPRRLMAMAMLVGFVEILVATVMGAWLYREAAEGTGSAARRAA